MRASAILMVGATLCAPAYAQTAPSAVKGRETFHRVGCYECHNYQGQGGVGPGLTSVGLERLKTYVRNANGNMPPYRPALLSDEDIADIYAYLTSIPKPPAADSLVAVRNLKKTVP